MSTEAPKSSLAGTWVSLTPEVRPTNGYEKWAVGQRQSIFGKSFAPFGLVEGRNFMEYDLVYVSHDLLFWGARNVDGRGFDTEENRPMNLQIPMERTR
jgi:hypothetical protein